MPAPVEEGARWPELRVAPAPPTGSPRLGARDAAVVVGIRDYAYVPDVPGADQNAVAWQVFLTTTHGVPAERVFLLRNHEATEKNILRRAADAASVVEPGGTLWFVFIGHGAPRSIRLDGDQRTEGVLVAVDAQNSADLFDHTVSSSELARVLGQGRGRVVQILDACFSGLAQNGSSLTGSTQPVVPVLDQPRAPQLMLTAGTSDQLAGSLLGSRVFGAERPAFSYLVLGALRGWGDANGDGQVSAREALAYATGVLLHENSRRQTPQISGPELDAPLTRASGERAPALEPIVAAAAEAERCEQDPRCRCKGERSCLCAAGFKDACEAQGGGTVIHHNYGGAACPAGSTQQGGVCVSRPLWAPFWVGVAATVGLAGGAAVTGGLALWRGSQYETLNASGREVDAANEAKAKVKTLNGITDGLIGGALLGAGLTTALYLTRPTAKVPLRGVQVVPMVGGHVQGVSLHARF